MVKLNFMLERLTEHSLVFSQQQRRERELRKQQEREQRRRYEEMEQLRREEERRHAEREQVYVDTHLIYTQILSSALLVYNSNW